MTTHFSTLAWRLPWTEETGGLQVTGSQRIRHDRSGLAHTYKLGSTFLRNLLNSYYVLGIAIDE